LVSTSENDKTDLLAPRLLEWPRMTAARVIGLGLLLFVVACDQPPAMTEMTRPTTAPTSLTSFNGTLRPQGRDNYAFSVSQDGYVEVTLLGLGAPPGTTVGLGIGTPSTDTCSTNYTVETGPSPAAQIVGTGLTGTLCVAIYDVGNLTEPALYTITVATP
jgi:hypothetical protein